MRILTVENLNVVFDGHNILRDLSFDLDKGENLAIIGPNGSGKTVLLRALLGMIPFEGVVRWLPKIRLGYVPQKIEADKHLPLNLKNLLYAKASVLGIRRPEVNAAAEEVGLSKNAAETPIGHLSGGQFQRALIAFALLGDPDALLFDEPTASIDQLGEQQIYELIHELQDRRGITVLLVSHDLSFVSRYSTKVLCINREKLCFGPPEETLTPSVLGKLYGEHHKYYHHLHHQHEHG
jgi:zinc transport system ATP-binding protein